MAATFNVMFDFGGVNGTPGTQQAVDALGPPNIRFKTADNATIDTVNPCVVPSGADKYSFWKHIYLKCTAAPSIKVDNIKFYTDGSAMSGVTTYVGNEMPTKNSGTSSGYAVATGTVDDTGNEMVTSHGGLTGKTDAFTYTSAAPKSITISETSSQIDAQNETTNYLVFQVTIPNTALPGDRANETWTYQYDEI